MKVVYAARARRDLEDIAAYLDARNPDAARRVAPSIRRTIARLQTFPLCGRRQEQNARKLVEPMFGYLVYYRFDGAVISIVTIRHPYRDRAFEDI